MNDREIVIRLQVPRWLKAHWIVAAGAATLLCGAWLYADSPSLHTFAAGEVLTKDNLNGNFTALRDAIAALQAVDRACPADYSQDMSVTAYVVCKKGIDEIIKVGSGATAFWIDRYEASIWPNADGSGSQSGNGADKGFPIAIDGSYSTPAYALSTLGADGSGVVPAGNMTWFQAQALCRLSGKRLPNGEEWLTAAAGTPLLPTDGTVCATARRMTGAGNKCLSKWGAEDMIGNFWEFTSEWSMPVGNNANRQTQNWPSGFTGVILNAATSAASYVSGVFIAQAAGTVTVSGLPAVVKRGGGVSPPEWGIFTVDLRSSAADNGGSDYGFRCVIPR
jgi:hypothetical protein